MIFITIFIIRIRIVYLFVKYFIYTKVWLNRFVLLLVLFFYCVINLASVPTFQRHHPPSHQKICFSNIRVLQGTIELYNMDHTPMMTTNIDMKTLVDNKYLKAPIEGPDEECEYLIEGDLTNDGYVYCINHGDTMGLKKNEIEARKEKKQKEKPAYHIKNFFSAIWDLEVKIDKSLSLLFIDSVNHTLFGVLITYCLIALGLAGPIVSCGGIINSFACLAILSMFKQDEDDEEDVVVYESSEESEEIIEANKPKDSNS